MDVQIIPITAGAPHKLFDMFEQALANLESDKALLLGGFAYATRDGVDHFVSGMKRHDAWFQVSKRFVIGIHHGITEPAALEMLCSLDNAEVRLFIPGNRLDNAALSSTPLYHPKVLALVNSVTGNLKFFQAGSANMTGAAIGVLPCNYEIGVALRSDGERSLSQGRSFGKWWTHIWAKSRAVDANIIRRYAKLRLKTLDDNPILRYAADPPSNPQAAAHFFIEVGAASGPPQSRHQVEFPKSLAAFFGEPRRQRRNLTLCRGSETWQGRPLSFKVTTLDVEIWRLGMPT